VADYSEYIGKATGRGTLVVERGPLTNFAKAVLDDSKVYANAEVARDQGFTDVPAPPTFGFSIQNWGRFEELQTAEQPESNPMFEVMGKLYASGGMVLHGEQEFTYHQPIVAGDVLTFEGVVRDIYEKPTGERTMTFIVVEDTYRNAAGELVLTSTMNLIHRS
jgi:N-terminal half of MaoC dehydratase